MEVSVPPKPDSERLAEQASHARHGQLTLLTFNTWGSAWRSEHYWGRLEKQAEYFRTSGRDLDVVFLQGVWTEPAASRLIAAAAEAGLSHVACFDAGVLGSGLLLLSRLPLEEVDFRPFSARGAPSEAREALAGKGIGYARALLPSGAPLHLFTTHLHGNPSPHHLPDRTLPQVQVPVDAHSPYRMAQLVEAAAFMRPRLAPALAAGELVFLGGSLSCPPDSLECSLLPELLPGLRDAWVAAGHAATEPAGDTQGCASNVFTDHCSYDSRGRVDAVWSNARVVACETVLTRVPDSRLSYSAHHGVMVVASSSAPPPPPPSAPTPAPPPAPAPAPEPTSGGKGPEEASAAVLAVGGAATLMTVQDSLPLKSEASLEGAESEAGSEAGADAAADITGAHTPPAALKLGGHEGSSADDDDASPAPSPRPSRGFEPAVAVARVTPPPSPSQPPPAAPATPAAVPSPPPSPSPATPTLGAAEGPHPHATSRSPSSSRAPSRSRSQSANEAETNSAGGDSNDYSRVATTEFKIPDFPDTNPDAAGPGPVAEARVAPEPHPGKGSSSGSDGSGGAPAVSPQQRRSRLLALALNQLRCGQSNCTARIARSQRGMALCTAVVLIAIAVQLYCVIASTDHWAKRLCGCVAVVGGLVCAVWGLLLLPAACMDRESRRAFRQLARSVEAWHRAGGGDGGGGGDGSVDERSKAVQG